MASQKLDHTAVTWIWAGSTSTTGGWSGLVAAGPTGGGAGGDSDDLAGPGGATTASPCLRTVPSLMVQGRIG